MKTYRLRVGDLHASASLVVAGSVVGGVVGHVERFLQELLSLGRRMSKCVVCVLFSKKSFEAVVFGGSGRSFRCHIGTLSGHMRPHAGLEIFFTFYS